MYSPVLPILSPGKDFSIRVRLMYPPVVYRQYFMPICCVAPESGWDPLAASGCMAPKARSGWLVLDLSRQRHPHRCDSQQTNYEFKIFHCNATMTRALAEIYKDSPLSGDCGARACYRDVQLTQRIPSLRGRNFSNPDQFVIDAQEVGEEYFLDGDYLTALHDLTEEHGGPYAVLQDVFRPSTVEEIEEMMREKGLAIPTRPGEPDLRGACRFLARAGPAT